MTDMHKMLTVNADASQVVTEGAKGATAIRDMGTAAKSTSSDAAVLRGSLTELVNKATGVNAGFASAAKSADVFSQALHQQDQIVEELRASLDPTYLATEKLRRGENALAAAFGNGSISIEERNRLLVQLRQQHSRATSAMAGLTRAQQNLFIATRGGAGGLQNFGYQVQDFAVQVGSGTAASVALGQQLPQLLSGFGTLGVLLGTIAAVAIPVGGALYGIGDGAADTTDKLGTLEEHLNDVSSSIRAASRELLSAAQSDLDTIRQIWGVVNDETLDLAKRLNLHTFDAEFDKVAKVIARTFDESPLEEFRTKYDEITQNIETMESRLDGNIQPGEIIAIGDVADALSQAVQSAKRMPELRDIFGVPLNLVTDVLHLSEVLHSALDSRDAEGLVAAIDELAELAAELPEGSLKNMTLEFDKMEKSARDLLKFSDDVATAVEQLSAQTNGAAAAAIRLNTFWAGVASSANDAATAFDSALDRQSNRTRTAEIRLQFRDDPVQLAGELAALDFTSQIDLEAIGSLQMAQEIAVQTQLIREQAMAAARLELERKTLEEKARLSEQAAKEDAREKERLSKQEEASYQRLSKSITSEIARLSDSYASDVEAAYAWRAEALAGLDATRVGYAEFVQDVETIFSARIAKAYDEDLKRRTDWQAGIERGLTDISEKSADWASTIEGQLKGLSDASENTFVEMFRTGRLNLDGLLDYALDAFAQMAYQAAIQPALNGVLKSAASSLGVTVGYSHAGSEIGATGVMRTQTGLASDERLTVTRLGQRVFTPEQIGNGAMVVDALAAAASAPRGGATEITLAINVNNQSSASVEVNETPDGLELRLYDDIEQRLAAGVKGGRSPLARAVQARFGVRKVF